MRTFGADGSGNGARGLGVPQAPTGIDAPAPAVDVAEADLEAAGADGDPRPSAET
jgi:hypothetical protein